MTTANTGLRDTLPPQPVGIEPAERAVVDDRGSSLAEPHTPRRQFPWSTVFAYCLLVGGSLVLLIPFVWMVKSSLSTEAMVQSGQITVEFGQTADGGAAGPQWVNYPESMRLLGADLGRFGIGWWPTFPALANTVFITSLSIAGQILSCSLVGYGFARFRFRGRGPLFMLMLSTMMLPAQVTMIPVFLLFRSLGMVDTFWPLILPMFLGSPFFVFMFRQFFAQVPEELMEAARIDGAGHFRVYWTMMLPLSTPVIAIVAIYTFMGTWNDFMGPLIYLNSPEKGTLATALNSFNGEYGVRQAHLLMAASFITMLPCIVLFFAAQRYFVGNLADSGLKG